MKTFLVLILTLLIQAAAWSQSDQDLAERWSKNDPAGEFTVDHRVLAEFLGEYLVTDHPSGVYLLPYGEVSREGRK